MTQGQVYEEFREEFKRHHICGADIIGLALTYDSRCPRCDPDGPQWEEECRTVFNEGRTIRFSGYWYREADLEFQDGRPVRWKYIAG